jgi:hypothetical protein
MEGSVGTSERGKFNSFGEYLTAIKKASDSKVIDPRLRQYKLCPKHRKTTTSTENFRHYWCYKCQSFWWSYYAGGGMIVVNMENDYKLEGVA